MKPTKPTSAFTRMASLTARMAGRPATFALAVALIVGWALLGPVFDFGDTWQLVFNTTTTIVTFLMVILVQSTQNRDGQAIQIKLDELIRSKDGAQNALLDLEELDEKDLIRIRARYEKLAEKAREQLSKNGGNGDMKEFEPEAESERASASRPHRSGG